MSEFQEYVAHEWKLVPIVAGQKGPRKRGWNRMENCLSDPEAVNGLRSAGLAHAYSGTCAIDVDDYAAAREWLEERGVALDDMFMAADAVQIISGKDNHGKLLYRLDEPMVSKQVKIDKKCVIDFRCATSTGLTMQDVLPPSIHPDTGLPYRWDYDGMLVSLDDLPKIPAELHKIWVDEVSNITSEEGDAPEKGAAVDELRQLLAHQDSDMSRDDWIRVGMAIHHETDGGEVGLNLWDEWSKTSDKYRSRADLETCWRSFHDTPNAITVGALRQGAIAQPDEFPDIASAPPTPMGDSDEVDPWAAQEQVRRDRFSLTHIGDLSSREPPEWIVETLIPQADLAMIYGAPGAGKSFIALDLAFAVAFGYTWFNRASKRGEVVWIAAEAAGSMRNRVAAYAQARGVDPKEADIYIVEQNLSLMEKEDANGLMYALESVSPSLIIVDTLAAASGGANENSGEDMNKVLDNCRRMHEATGALILLIHHTGKDASRGARGWSGMKAAMHTEISIYHKEGSPFRIMETTKQRDTVEGEQFPFKLQVVPLDLEGMESCVIDPLEQSILGVSDSGEQLKGTPKIIFDSFYARISKLDEGSSVALQDVYDDAIVQLPAPARGERDRRNQNMQRAVASLHERGYFTVDEDRLSIGSNLDD